MDLLGPRAVSEARLFALDADLRVVGAPCLPHVLVSETTTLVVLAVESAGDVTLPDGASSGGGHTTVPSQRMLRLRLSDGFSFVTAFEWQPCPHIPATLAPGTKVSLKLPVETRAGLVLLKPDTLTVLGGSVEEHTALRVAAAAAAAAAAASAASPTGAPAFEPFNPLAPPPPAPPLVRAAPAVDCLSPPYPGTPAEEDPMANFVPRQRPPLPPRRQAAPSSGAAALAVSDEGAPTQPRSPSLPPQQSPPSPSPPATPPAAQPQHSAPRPPPPPLPPPTRPPSPGFQYRSSARCDDTNSCSASATVEVLLAPALPGRESTAASSSAVSAGEQRGRERLLGRMESDLAAPRGGSGGGRGSIERGGQGRGGGRRRRDEVDEQKDGISLEKWEARRAAAGNAAAQLAQDEALARALQWEERLYEGGGPHGTTRALSSRGDARAKELAAAIFSFGVGGSSGPPGDDHADHQAGRTRRR